MLKNRITEIRNQRGLSVEELAERADLSPSYVSLMARGKRNISLRNLEKLAVALECHPQELIEDPVEDIAKTDLLNEQLLGLWASIPPERQELAWTILKSFANVGVDAPDSSEDTEKKDAKK